MPPIDRGIRSFDTAWLYSKGESETRVGLVAKERRDEMWIATKARDRTQDEALKQLDESLGRLQTNYVNEWRMHDARSFDDLDECFAKGGVMEAMVHYPQLRRRVSSCCDGKWHGNDQNESFRP